MARRIPTMLWLALVGLILTAAPAAAATFSAGANPPVGADVTFDGGDCEPGDDCGGDDGGGDCEPGDDCGGDDGGDDCEPGDDCGGDDGDDGDDDDDGAGVLKFDERSFLGLESTGLVVITVERSHGEDGAVSVAYATSDGTATAGVDYQAASGVLEWAAGDGATKTFTIQLLDDGVAEGNETVELALSDPTGGAVLDAERSTAVLVVSEDGGDDLPPGDDDDGAGTFKFSDRGFQVIEGQAFALIGVERSHGEAGIAAVEYAAAAGSAGDGADFQAVSGVLSWAAGDGSTKTFQVPILDDSTTEGTETVTLALSNPTGGATVDPERGSVLLSILDDDGTQATCQPGGQTLCLLDGRFSAEITFRTPNVPGANGRAQAQPISAQAGLFSFFDPANAEMLIKVIDACGVPGFDAYWVFYAATTNVDFTLTVTDRVSGVAKQYFNPLGKTAEPVQDVATFKTCN